MEGMLDEAVVRRLLAAVGARQVEVYGGQGKHDLLRHLRGYNQAARHGPWLVLVDLDDEECAPALCQRVLPQPAPGMCLRVAVREVEAWLLADREGLSRFLGVSPGRIPVDPEQVARPKELMVALAAASRRRDVREDLVPRPDSGRRVGPAYSSRLADFVRERWRPEVAAQRSRSLERCLARLKTLTAGACG